MKEHLSRICKKYTDDFGIDVRDDLNYYQIKLGKEGMKYAKEIAKNIESVLAPKLRKIRVDYNRLNDVYCWVDVYPKDKVEDSVKAKDYKPELLAELKKIAMEGDKIRPEIDKAYKAYYNIDNYYSWQQLKKENPKKADLIIKSKQIAQKRVNELAKRWDKIIEEMNRGKDGLPGNFDLLSRFDNSVLPTSENYEEVERSIKNLEKSHGKSPYSLDSKPKDSLKTFMFTSTASGRKFIVKGVNANDAMTKFYNHVNDSKVKDSQYVYLVNPKTEAEEIEKAKKLGMSLRQIGGLIEIGGTGKQFTKLTGFDEAKLDEFSQRMMSAIRKVSDSKVKDDTDNYTEEELKSDIEEYKYTKKKALKSYILRNAVKNGYREADIRRLGGGILLEDSVNDGPIKTARGTFPLVNESEESLRNRGYAFHHMSEDGKYKIMTNHKTNSAVAIKAEDSKIINNK